MAELLEYTDSTILMIESRALSLAAKDNKKRPLPLAPIGSYCDGSPRLLTPRAAKKARVTRVIQDSSDEEDSSNDSEAADTLEAGRF